MMQDLILKQLLATRASAEALIQSIDMFQSLVTDKQSVTGKAPEPAPPPSDPPEDENGVCSHPLEHRLPTPTMGNVHRQLCGVCGQEVDKVSKNTQGSKEEA